MVTPIICGHPDRKHNAHGMCKSCFNKRYKKTKERAKMDSKNYRERHYEEVLIQNRIRNRDRSRTPEGKIKSREWHLKKNFGITLDEYQAIYQAQGGVCAICENPETATRRGVIKFLAVDHDHETGKVRGLLCQACNCMIGYAQDNLDILKAAIEYLEDK